MNLYGCHNTTRQPNYMVQDGYLYEKDPFHGWTQITKLRVHEDTMSKDCRYDRKEHDPRCAGCKRQEQTAPSSD